MVEQLQRTHHFSRHDVEIAIKQAVGQREDELRVLVMKREEEVAASMTKREEEIMEAVRRREEEVCGAWVKREEEIRNEFAENCRLVQEQAAWVNQREVELKDEEARMEEMREELEADIQRAEQIAMKGNVSLSICVRPLSMTNFVTRTKKQESFRGGQEYPPFGFTYHASETSTSSEGRCPAFTYPTTNTHPNHGARDTYNASYLYRLFSFCYEGCCSHHHRGNPLYTRTF